MVIEEAWPGVSGRFRFRERLADPRPLVAVELRPPRRDLEGIRAMDAWIDVYHGVQKLSAEDTVVFLTDNAVGTGEEENVTHLVRNLGAAVERQKVVPFLTLKHPLNYCLTFAQRVQREGFPALVVLGGDPHDGIPRCLPRSWDMRAMIRREHPGLLLGGWANPHRDPEGQVDLLLRNAENLDFVLTQVVSHHQLDGARRLLDAAGRCGFDRPIFAGLFFYRSAREKTLRELGRYIPVPVDELRRDFGERRLSAEDVAAATLEGLARTGFTRFYISNLETSRASGRRGRLLNRAGLGAAGKDEVKT